MGAIRAGVAPITRAGTINIGWARGLSATHMHSSIAQKRADISKMCQRHRIHRLEVFGSAARATDFDPVSSDADFLVEFEPGAKDGLDSYFAFKADLEALLQRGVDLVEPGALRNPYLLAGINSAREVVYAA
jgi:uncharacterized protein